MSIVVIATLGEFSVRASVGDLPPALAQRRRLSVFLYIAAAGASGVTRERLLATFWPERSDDPARNLLNQALSAIRQLSPELVRTGPAGEVRLEPALVRLDASEFERHCASRSWGEAIALYRGAFLDGFALPGAPDFERWVERERVRLERSYAAALEGMAREATERVDTSGAERWWRERMSLEPTSGRAVRALMQVLAASGERAQAIEEARKYERILREELSVEIDEETATLVRALQHGGRASEGRLTSDARLPPIEGVVQDAPLPVGGERQAADSSVPDRSIPLVTPAAVTDASLRMARRRRIGGVAGLVALAVAAWAWGAVASADRRGADRGIGAMDTRGGEALSDQPEQLLDRATKGGGSRAMPRDAASEATAIDFYLQGKRYYDRAERLGPVADATSSLVDTAEYFLKRALQSNPRHAPSHAHLSVTALGRYNLGQGVRWLDSASGHARRAVAIDSNHAMSVVALGLAQFMASKRKEGRATLWRAAQLAPNDPVVLIALHWTGSGRLEDDIALTERLLLVISDDERPYNDLAFKSMIIDDTTTMRVVDEKGMALFPESRDYAWGYRARRALVHVYRGDSAAARAEVRAYTEGEWKGRSAALAATIELALGDMREARRYLERSATLYARERRAPADSVDQDEHMIQGWFLSTSLAYFDLQSGDSERARRRLARREREDSLILVRYGESNDVLYDLAVIAALRDEAPRALHFLARAVDAGYLLHRWIRFDPRLASLRGEAGFGTVVERARLRADSIRALVVSRRGRG